MTSITNTSKCRGAVGRVLYAVFAALFVLASWAPVEGQESICVRVRIEIEQELTLERQGFEARMRIKNGALGALENINVVMNFVDAAGQPVVATTDPNSTTAKFFYRYSAGATPPTTIASGGDETLKWLIVPSPGASTEVGGTRYFVGATLTYRVAGEDVRVDVTPDAINVLPMPLLTLDYFLPDEVYGDDPFSNAIEPPIPFSLGVRVKNTGLGIARNLKIESSQPKIIENELGLLIDFKIHGSEVNGMPYLPTLLIDFGSIDPARSGVGRWSMTSSLYGKFIEFTARFSHADELGGQLTSLITDVQTHFLVHDVLVDLTGRDNVRDFLARDGGVMRVYESENLDSEVVDVSSQSSIAPSAGNWVVTVPPSVGFSHVKLSDPTGGGMKVLSARRSDGRQMSIHNVWQSRTFVLSGRYWQYFLHIFDANNASGASYTVSFTSAGLTNRPPQLLNPGDRIVSAASPLSLPISANDPDGTAPALTVSSLPSGATFVDEGGGRGALTWTPGSAQIGNYPVQFVASDGILTDRKTVVITVAGTSLHAAWKDRYWPGVTDLDVIGHAANPDGDDLPNLLEYAVGGDPTRADPSSGPEVRVEQIDGVEYLTITYLQRLGDPLLHFTAMVTESLRTAPELWTATSLEIPVDQAGVPSGFRRVKIRDPQTVDVVTGPKSRYMQVRVRREE